jgi:T-complex protein 1 subunit theta
MQGMLKDGARHMSGLEEATYKNIEAAKQLSSCVRTSLGPNGMNKMVINHLEKLFITNDSATIVEQLEVQHPAAKLLVMASQMQESPIFSLCFIPALQTPFSRMPHARFSHISGM